MDGNKDTALAKIQEIKDLLAQAVDGTREFTALGCAQDAYAIVRDNWPAQEPPQSHHHHWDEER